MRKFVVFAAALALAALPALAADYDAAAAKSTFETKCSKCHGIDRPLSKNKDAAGWQETVKRMQGKLAGHISDAEAAAIARYLSEMRAM